MIHRTVSRRASDDAWGEVREVGSVGSDSVGSPDEAIGSPAVARDLGALWHALGHERAAVEEAWPVVDESARVRDTIEVVVQVNGKLRSRVAVAAEADEAAVREAALADSNVQRYMEGRPVRKFIYVRGKLANVVV